MEDPGKQSRSQQIDAIKEASAELSTSESEAVVGGASVSEITVGMKADSTSPK